MRQPYKHFDLPTQHLGGEHYVPARTRDPDEALRRRLLPRGTVLAEQQRDGLRVAQHMLEQELDERDETFVTQVLAASGLNTSWYSFARDSDVMRRRLQLPTLADDQLEWRESREGLREKLRANFAQAVELGEALAQRMAEGVKPGRLTTLTGRTLGNCSLQLACVRLGEAPLHVSAFQLQAMARREGLASLELARQAAGEVGAAPSVAQLADADSPLSVYWRRHAPDGAFQALEEAQSSSRMVSS